MEMGSLDLVGDTGLWQRGRQAAWGRGPGHEAAICALGVGGRRRGRSGFKRGLTVQRGLLRLVAFPGVCIFMLIGSLRCVCC